MPGAVLHAYKRDQAACWSGGPVHRVQQPWRTVQLAPAGQRPVGTLVCRQAPAGVTASLMSGLIPDKAQLCSLQRPARRVAVLVMAAERATGDSWCHARTTKGARCCRRAQHHGFCDIRAHKAQWRPSTAALQASAADLPATGGWYSGGRTQGYVFSSSVVVEEELVSLTAEQMREELDSIGITYAWDLRTTGSPLHAAPVLLKEVAFVANINGSSVDYKRSWIRLWEDCCGQHRGKCAARGCNQAAECGGHVWLQDPDGGISMQFSYIVPLCSDHNQASSYPSTFQLKEGAWAVHITPHAGYADYNALISAVWLERQAWKIGGGLRGFAAAAAGPLRLHVRESLRAAQS